RLQRLKLRRLLRRIGAERARGRKAVDTGRHVALQPVDRCDIWIGLQEIADRIAEQKRRHQNNQRERPDQPVLPHTAGEAGQHQKKIKDQRKPHLGDVIAVHLIGADGDDQPDNHNPLKGERRERRAVPDVEEVPGEQHQRMPHDKGEGRKEIKGEARETAGAALDLDPRDCEKLLKDDIKRAVKEEQDEEKGGKRKGDGGQQRDGEERQSALLRAPDQEAVADSEDAIDAGLEIVKDERRRDQPEQGGRPADREMAKSVGEQGGQRQQDEAKRQRVRRHQVLQRARHGAGEQQHDEKRRCPDKPPVLRPEALTDEQENEAEEQDIDEDQQRLCPGEVAKGGKFLPERDELRQQQAIGGKGFI